jgi:hypothetical protein
MKTYKKLAILCLVIFSLTFSTCRVEAATPTLSLFATGSGDSVTISVTGDSNSNVIFYYSTTTGSGLQNRIIGSTNMYGNFSAVISTSSYGITPGNSVYVIVNNQQSSSLIWPNSSSSSSSLSLSQTSVSLAVGQTSTITAYNTSYYGGLYISSNSNSNVATATISGNTISIYGVSVGSSTVAICQSSGTNYCSNVYVTVGGTYIYNNYPYNNTYPYISTNSQGFNVSNLDLSVGNSVTMSGPNSVGVYASSNSNPGVASVEYSSSSYALGCSTGSQYNTLTGQPCYVSTVNNNTVTVVITALSIGSDTITLCQNNSSGICSTIYVNVSRVR